ncbi:MAG: hypothetical protein EOP49_43915 [Sphingobacteriales bacterium]|nr:MAG: hypothetical protein EOP49_43915 [Sphingobacteriales bacterium]
MDRYVFLAAPITEGALSVYYDINSGYYDCEVDNQIAATIAHNDNTEWIDVNTGSVTDFSTRIGALIDKQLAAD